jgi:hypothetical protein
MQCADITERLLDDELGSDPQLDQHVAECGPCAHVAHGLARLDAVLGSSLVVVPPLDLQRQLAQLALDAARPSLVPAPAAVPWWQRVTSSLQQWNPVALLQRPQMVAVQGLAAVLLALASWQVFGWMSTLQPVVGDVGYAMELVVASPAAVYLSGMQLDLQSLGVWSLVGLGGWLISEDGLIGRRFSSKRLRQP